MTETLNFHVEPGGCLLGDVRVPGDKSISHRAVMLGAIAEGVTRIDGFLQAQDALATIRAFRSMGVEIEKLASRQIIVHGVGLHGLRAPNQSLDFGNSGTAMRLMAGLLSGQSFDSELIGDGSLSKRPMQRITDPLKKMGALIETQPDGTAPISIRGDSHLSAIEYTMPVASAQIKSCLLLAAMYAEGRTCIIEPAPSRDHTERMLNGMAYPVQVEGNQISTSNGGRLIAANIDIPADISSAAFFMVGASISEGSDIILRHVGINPTRAGLIEILRMMGASIELINRRIVGGEPVADIRVKSAKLTGVHIPEYLVPSAIDEFPVLFVAAACAVGETLLTGAKELRVKESDRIDVMTKGLKRLGIDACGLEDGIRIRGGSISGGRIDSHGDHRVAMSFAIAALMASDAIEIIDCKNVDTSFPDFIGTAQNLGLKIEGLMVSQR